MSEEKEFKSSYFLRLFTMPVKRASRKRRIIKTEPEEIVNGHRSDDTEGKCSFWFAIQ